MFFVPSILHHVVVKIYGPSPTSSLQIGETVT